MVDRDVTEQLKARYTIKLDDDMKVVGSVDAGNSFTVPGDKYIIVGPPAPAGYFKVTDHFSIQSIKRPNWLHRKMARLLLGWEWRELK